MLILHLFFANYPFAISRFAFRRLLVAPYIQVWLKHDRPTGKYGQPFVWPVVQPVWWKDDGPKVRTKGRLRSTPQNVNMYKGFARCQDGLFTQDSNAKGLLLSTVLLFPELTTVTVHWPEFHTINSTGCSLCWAQQHDWSSVPRSTITSSTCCETASTGFPSRSASSSICVFLCTRHCMDWHRRTLLTSVDQSQPSVADRLRWIHYLWRPCCLLLCSAFLHPCICCGGF